jgi:hypothetical protein
MKLFERPYYTDRIKPFIDKRLIKVLTGQRRVGKSYILLQLMQNIRIEHPDSKIIYINKEQEQFRFIQTEVDFFTYLNQEIDPNRSNYLFVDEIQDITGWENVLRSLLAEERCDIFCTGSNAKMLSGELSTYLSGRYIEFHIHSLTYKEFLYFHNLTDEDNSLSLYLTYGGLPHLSHLSLTDDIAFEYLRNVYSTILLKDVIARENIRNVAFIESLAGYIADNVGNLFSATNISKYLKSQRTAISTPVIINYLKFLCNAFIVSKTQRFDIQGLKKFEIGEKYYFEDLGLRNCISGFDFARDIHKLMENVVYQHLNFMGFEVFVGKLDSMEIDFVALKEGKKVYVQVAYLIMDEETRKREFGNLLKINDNFPKYVVTMDSLNRGSNHEGIIHLHLRDFLKTEKLITS